MKLVNMKCCYCGKVISQKEVDEGKAHEIFGAYSHVACDDIYFQNQEKKVKYVKYHVFETEEL